MKSGNSNEKNSLSLSANTDENLPEVHLHADVISNQKDNNSELTSNVHDQSNPISLPTIIYESNPENQSKSSTSTACVPQIDNTKKWEELLENINEQDIEAIDLSNYEIDDQKASKLLDSLIHNWYLIDLKLDQHYISEEILLKLKKLLERNQNIHSFYLAIRYGNLDKVKEMNGCDLSGNHNDISTPLHVAAYFGHLNIVKYFLEHHVDVNATRFDGNTPLLFAAYNGHFDVVKFLIENGSNVNISNVDGDTAIHAATYYMAHANIIDYLIKHGASINTVNKGGKTALHYAARTGNLDTVKIFIENHASINAKNKLGNTPLLIAVYNNKLNVVKYLIKNGANTNISNENGSTSLFYAASNGYLEIMEYLLSHGADINKKNKIGFTPLHIAAKKGHLHCVQALIANSASINSIDEEGNSPLIKAAENGNLEIVKFLVEQGADIELPNKDGFTALYASAARGHLEIYHYLVTKNAKEHVTNESRIIPLHIAAHNGELSMVKFLIEQGEPVNMANKDNLTPIIFAALAGQLEIIEYLYQNGADIEIVTTDGNTPLHCATTNGHIETIKYLISKNANLNSKNQTGFTPLHIAAREGYLDIVKYLTESDSIINDIDNDGNTPLVTAANNGHLDIVKYLVEKGADVNKANHKDFTPFYNAASHGYIEIVRYLLSKKANINAEIKGGYTPLHIAARKGYFDIVQYLIKNGAAINAKNDDADTPLNVAVMKGNLDIVKYLIDSGALFNLKNNDSCTPLHIASTNGYSEIVNFLLEKGANVTIRDHENKTPFLKACIEGHFDVVKLLLENGEQLSIDNQEEAMPLFGAVVRGHLEVVKLLVEHYKKITRQDISLVVGNFSLVHFAAISGNLNLIKYFIELGADIHLISPEGQTTLYTAVWSGNIEMLKFLLDSGIDINLPNSKGKTPLHTAINKGNLDVVKFLVSHGAKMDAQTKKGYTPAFLAASKGHLEILKYLRDKGADIQYATDDNFTLLHIAAQSGHLNIVKYLIKNCYMDKDDVTNELRFTPLHYAAQNGHTDVVKFLISQGVNVNAFCVNDLDRLREKGLRDDPADLLTYLIAKSVLNVAKKMVDYVNDNGGLTPLYVAIKNGHLDVVKLLIESGADIDKVNDKRESPLSLATEEHQQEIIDYLNNLKNNPNYADVFYKRGDKKLDANENKLAIAEYDCALKTRPTFADAYLMRGLANSKLGQHQEALKDLNHAINNQQFLIKNTFTDVLALRAEIKQKLMDFDGAISDLDTCIALKSDHWQAYHQRANAKMSINKVDEAIKDYSVVIEETQSVDAYYKRGVAKSLKNDYNNALIDFDKVIAERPEYFNAYIDRGRIKENIDDLEGALKDYEATLSVYPHNEKAMTAIAVVKKIINDPEYQVRKLFDLVKRNDPSLNSLDLTDKKLNPKQFNEFCCALKNNHTLTKLIINCSEINSESFKQLCQSLLFNKNINRLHLIGYSPTVSDYEQLSNLLNYNNTISTLSIKDTNQSKKVSRKFELPDKLKLVFEDNYGLEHITLGDLSNEDLIPYLARNKILHTVVCAIRDNDFNAINQILTQDSLGKDTFPWILRIAYDAENHAIIKQILNQYINLDELNDGETLISILFKNRGIQSIEKVEDKTNSKNTKKEETTYSKETQKQKFANQCNQRLFQSIEFSKPKVKKELEDVIRRIKVKAFENSKELNVEHEIYVEPDAGVNKSSMQRYPIHEIMDQYLEDPNRSSLLLLGDSGLGKSFLAKQLFNKYWHLYDLNQIPFIPIHITLTSIKNEDRKESLLESHLANLGLCRDEIKLLKQHCQQGDIRLLIILDGFDELNPQPQQSIYESNNWVNEWGTPKVVTTSRPEAFSRKSDYQRLFYPSATSNHAFSEYYLQPFNEEQIQTYLKNYDLQDSIKYGLNYLYKIHPLQEIIKNPLILSMLVKILPKIGYDLEINYDHPPKDPEIADKTLYLYINGGQISLVGRHLNGNIITKELTLDATKTKELKDLLQETTHKKQLSNDIRGLIFKYAAKFGFPPKILDPANDPETITYSREQIYAEFVNDWIDNQIKRLFKDQDKINQIRDHYKPHNNNYIPFETGFKKALFRYLQNLAILAWNKGNGKLDVSLCEEETLKHELLSPTENEKPFLIESNIQDVLKLMRSCALLICDGDHYKFHHKSFLEYFACHALFTGADVIADNMIKNLRLENIQSNFELNSHSLQNEPNIISLLADIVNINSEFKQNLYKIIELSKYQGCAIAAANAITILKVSGEVFNNKSKADFTGIQIPNADLSGAICDETNFSGADLTGVNFENAWLRNANLEHAFVDQASFSSSSLRQKPDIKAMSGENGQYIIFLPRTNSFCFVKGDKDDIKAILPISKSLNCRNKISSLHELNTLLHYPLTDESLEKELHLKSDTIDRNIIVKLVPIFNLKSKEPKLKSFKWDIDISKEGEHTKSLSIEQPVGVELFRALSPNQQYLVLGANYDHVFCTYGYSEMKIVNLQNNQIISKLSNPGKIKFFTFSPDSKSIITVLDKAINIQDIDSHKFYNIDITLDGKNPILAVSVDQSKNLIAYVTKSGDLTLFDRKQNAIIYKDKVPFLLSNKNDSSITSMYFCFKNNKNYLKFIDQNNSEYTFKIDEHSKGKLLLIERIGDIQANTYHTNLEGATNLSKNNLTFFKDHNAIGNPLNQDNERSLLLKSSKIKIQAHLPNHTRSKTYSKLPIDYDNWVVSLLCNPNSHNNNQHAYLLLEGMNEWGQLLLYRFELVTHESDDPLNPKESTPIPSNYAKVIVKDHEPVLIKQHRDTLNKEIIGHFIERDFGDEWTISRQKAIQLLASVYKEKDKFIPYSIKGQRTLFHTKHNCYTWAREKLLSLNVKNINESSTLKKDVIDEFIAITSRHLTKPPDLDNNVKTTSYSF